MASMVPYASFPGLPAELLDHICSFIIKPKDLLSLALTTHLLYQLIVPTHIEFRILRCDIRRKHLWRRLVEYSAITSQIVALEIIPEENATANCKGIVVPVKFFGRPDLAQDLASQWSRESHWGPASDVSASGVACASEWDCIQAFSDAIPHMRRLTIFHWADYTMLCTPSIFAALLQSCPRLRDVEVMIDGDFVGASTNDIATSPLWELQNLHRFSLTFMHIHLDQSVATKYVDRMTKMLVNHCPDLEELLLRLGSRTSPNNISALIENGYWPRLKNLSLAAELSRNHDTVLTTFFTKHPQLERLQLCEGITRSPILRLSNLPNLRSLHLGWGVACKDIAIEVTKNLEYLGLFLDSGQDERLGELLAKMPRLRQFELVGVTTPLSLTSVISLVNACPRLERLALHGGHLEIEEEAFNDLQKLHGCFEGFTQLTHLSIRGKEFGVQDIFSNFAETLPSLCYIETGIRTYVWYTIERREEGGYAGYHTTEQMDGLDIEDWGGMYCGARCSVWN